MIELVKLDLKVYNFQFIKREIENITLGCIAICNQYILANWS